MPSQCYCAPLGDCSGGMSREHYLSRGILDLIARGETLRVEGIPAINGGKPIHLRPDGLAAKVLCQHHNNTLTDLDATALRFFTMLRHETPETECQISGLLLQRWYLKAALGNKAALTRGFTAPLEWLEMLVGRRPFAAQAGLAFQRAGEPLREFYDGFSFNLHFADPGLTQLCGAWLSLSSTSGYLLLDPDVPPTNRVLSLRPAFVSVQYPDKMKKVLLYWGYHSSEPGVGYSHPGPTPAST